MVSDWLTSIGVPDVDRIFRKHKICGQALLQMRESDLRSPPMSLPCLGDIKILAAHIRQLRRTHAPRSSIAPRHSLGSNRGLGRTRRAREHMIGGLSDNSEDEPVLVHARAARGDDEDDADESDRSDTTSIFSFENDDETTPLNENSRK
ncbi:sphingomyelin synthase-related protein 1-like, partial [Tropilaelaps mercedesae]